MVVECMLVGITLDQFEWSLSGARVVVDFTPQGDKSEDSYRLVYPESFLVACAVEGDITEGLTFVGAQEDCFVYVTGGGTVVYDHRDLREKFFLQVAEKFNGAGELDKRVAARYLQTLAYDFTKPYDWEMPCDDDIETFRDCLTVLRGSSHVSLRDILFPGDLFEGRRRFVTGKISECLLMPVDGASPHYLVLLDVRAPESWEYER